MSATFSQGIHHFPGHMKKALDRLAPYVKGADFLVEICDARAPFSTRNPLFDTLAGTKPRLIVLSKGDLADESVTSSWVAYFRGKGIPAFSGNLVAGKILPLLRECSKGLLERKREKERRIGMKPQDARILVFGVPNVGKSTFINALAGRRHLKSENRPGVTRAEQWLRIEGGFTLLDTPGILPMRYEEKEQALHLALLGSIPDRILPEDQLFLALVGFLQEYYPFSLKERFGIEDLSGLPSEEVEKRIALRRGLLGVRGEPRLDEAESLLLREFRAGLLGKMSLERPCA